jgi:hypothetical protein
VPAIRTRSTKSALPRVNWVNSCHSDGLPSATIQLEKLDFHYKWIMKMNFSSHNNSLFQF